MQKSQLFKDSKIILRASARGRFKSAIIFFAIVCFFGVFGIAGHNNVDMGRWFGPCGFQQRYSLPCPTCGMTTATLAFAQGRVLEAFYIQPAAGLFCLLFVITAVSALFTAVTGLHFKFVAEFFREIKVRYIILALAVIVLAGWAVTLTRALMAR